MADTGTRSDELIVCIDRMPRPQPKRPKARAALVKEFQWQSGDVIRVAFLDGDSGVQEKVKEAAKGWLDFVNLDFQFVQDAGAHIRISFRYQGSWSRIGKDCRSAPAGDATMNFGWLTPESDPDEIQRVVLHEFGHALGLIHEHQNPAGGIEWNKPAVYAYYEGPPNNWSPEEVDQNLFQLYDRDLTQFTDVDPLSIMMYPIPREFTLDGFEAGLNKTLSATDKQFMGEIYP